MTFFKKPLKQVSVLETAGFISSHEQFGVKRNEIVFSVTGSEKVKGRRLHEERLLLSSINLPVFLWTLVLIKAEKRKGRQKCLA